MRETVLFLMKVKNTDGDLVGTTVAYLKSMCSLLAAGDCHIWDLFSFMEVEQIVGFRTCVHVVLLPFIHPVI